MQNDEEAKGSKINPEFHPDSEYDNWTVRSYDVKTPYEDIPQWMKMYTESSIDTHEFFKFDRFEYKELDDWQKMLLKLYREDLRKVIRYYEDYRVALLKEIMERRAKEGEQVSEETERHSVCPNQHENPTLTVENNQSASSLAPELNTPSPGDETPVSPTNSLSPGELSSGDLTPVSPGDLTPLSPVKFKRFGHRSSSRSHNKEDILLAIENHHNKQSDNSAAKEAFLSTPPHSANHTLTTPPHSANHTLTTPPLISNHSTSSVDSIKSEPQPAVCLSVDKTKGVSSASPTSFPKGSVESIKASTGDLKNGGSSEIYRSSAEEEDSLSPKLDRMRGFRRRVRGRLHSNLFNNTENVDRNNMIDDFPSPKHVRSASTRHSSLINDFPSPLLQRSASDRPKNRHSVHAAGLHGVYRESSISSCNTLDSEDSGFSRSSSKRIITSPKMKAKSEPGSNNATVIPGSKKERRISKMLSRAASFGRKDKNKVTNKVREQSRGRKEEQSVGVVSRVSRKEAFLAAKNELLTKETVV